MMMIPYWLRHHQSRSKWTLSSHCMAREQAIYGLREAPRLWQQERDQKLRDLEFMYKDKLAHLVQSHIHHSLWFIAEGPRVSTPGIPPFDHCLRSDKWTTRLHDHHILGYVGVYVDDLLIEGPRLLNDCLIHAVRSASTPEHLGPDSDCVPVLRFLGMNLERVDLLNQMEYIIEVLRKFEPSLQLKVRTTPENQPSRLSRQLCSPLMMRSRSIFNHSRLSCKMRSLKLTRSRRPSTGQPSSYSGLSELDCLAHQTIHCMGNKSSNKPYHS